MVSLPQAYRDKHKETVEVRVTGVVRHPNGRIVDITLEYDWEFKFEPSDGIGIPASLSEKQLIEICSLLREDVDPNYRLHLTPHQGYPGPNYAEITDEFIERLIEASISILHRVHKDLPFYEELEKKVAIIFHIKQRLFLSECLKSNYTVIDILRLFPDILTAQDIVETIPPEHGNKTYTPDTRILEPGKEKQFRINVLKETGPRSYRALFGEKGTFVEKTGMSSGYLHSLKPGDTLAINRKLKKGPKLPKFKERNAGRPILMISQGNSAIRFLPLLEDIRQRRAAGEKIGTVVFVGAFRTRTEILELSQLRLYVADGTVSTAHFTLGHEEPIAGWEKHEKGIYLHPGKRIQKIIEQPLFDHILLSPLGWLFSDMVQSQINFFKFFALAALSLGSFCKKKNPFIFVSGGEKFVLDKKDSAGAFLADRYGYIFPSEGKTDGDIRYSSSKCSIPQSQGIEYRPLEGHKALENLRRYAKLFSQLKTE